MKSVKSFAPAVAMLLLAPALAQALASDREKPIQIEADRVVIDEKQRISTYEGNVELVQGTLRLTAARVEVYRGEELERVVATGAPVTFRQQPDEGKEIRGQSQRADYLAPKSTIELTGEAHLWQGNDEFSGPRIMYDAERSVVRAEGQGGSGGRVSATIHPRKKTEQGQ
jgi:lipopolysaccharide export system protein LptA